MKIILYDHTDGTITTVPSGNQKIWDILSDLERKIIHTLLDHDNQSIFDGKMIKMGSVIARLELTK